MGVLRASGSTRLSLTVAGASPQPRDEVLEAVREAAAGEFTVLGEIGRKPDGTIAYLARDIASKRLAVPSAARRSAGGGGSAPSAV